MTRISELPFDQYQRYALVSNLLESVRGSGESFRILDVGGRTALLREFCQTIGGVGGCGSFRCQGFGVGQWRRVALRDRRL